MAVTGSEIVAIIPIYKCPNKFYWTGRVSAAGDVSGGGVQLNLDLSTVSIFGGHWLWSLEQVQPETSDQAGPIYCDVWIWTGLSARPNYQMLTVKRRYSLGQGSTTVIPWATDRFCDDFYRRKYKPIVSYPHVQVRFDVNTNLVTYYLEAWGYIYDEKMEGSLGNL